MTAEQLRGVRLCLCADDFGLHESVNEAVLRLAEMSRVHAIGALVGGPAWHKGAGALRHLAAHGIDIGLHLDFTEFPFLPGSRKSLGHVIALGMLHSLAPKRVRAEIRVQLDAFETALGHGPAFVDGHQHVHQLPVIRDQLLAELDDRYNGHRPWIRSTRVVPSAGPGAPASSCFKASVIGLLGSRSLSVAARRLGFAQNGGLLGVYDFHGGEPRYAALLRGWLRAARESDLLMCHPGLGYSTSQPLAAAREAEYRVIAGQAFGDLLRESGLSLWPMSQILALRA